MLFPRPHSWGPTAPGLGLTREPRGAAVRTDRPGEPASCPRVRREAPRGLVNRHVGCLPPNPHPHALRSEKRTLKQNTLPEKE